ncbi:hypothetical protein ZWY2020_008686 [Hordeum vulgare]|nr:hypothetical protein ZWY2020_008686 [Hordeum vulgare]
MLGRLAARRPRPGSTRAIVAAVAYRSSAAACSSVLPDALDRSSDAYPRNAAAVGGLLFDLRPASRVRADIFPRFASSLSDLNGGSAVLGGEAPGGEANEAGKLLGTRSTAARPRASSSKLSVTHRCRSDQFCLSSEVNCTVLARE